jgi:hypothetical protein
MFGWIKSKLFTRLIRGFSFYYLKQIDNFAVVCLVIISPQSHLNIFVEIEIFVLFVCSLRRHTDSSTTAEQSSSSEMDTMGDVSCLLFKFLTVSLVETLLRISSQEAQ